MSYQSGYLVGAARGRALGDYYADAATTDAAGSGTSSGNGYFAQLWAWVSGTVAAASDDPPAVQQWLAAVKQRGNVGVRWPFADSFHGELAERETNYDTDGVTIAGFSYYLAPLDVVNADRARRGVAALSQDVILPLAQAGESLAHIVTGQIGRAALLAGGALLVFNLLTRRR